MPEDDRPMRITEITLRPHIVVADGTDEGLVHEYLERGHKGCFIANSLGSKISIEPRIEHASASTADRAAR
jgi:organic hydroperoxide reductase OsmC/OhrA